MMVKVLSLQFFPWCSAQAWTQLGGILGTLEVPKFSIFLDARHFTSSSFFPYCSKSSGSSKLNKQTKTEKKKKSPKNQHQQNNNSKTKTKPKTYQKTSHIFTFFLKAREPSLFHPKMTEEWQEQWTWNVTVHLAGEQAPGVWGLWEASVKWQMWHWWSGFALAGFSTVRGIGLF